MSSSRRELMSRSRDLRVPLLLVTVLLVVQLLSLLAGVVLDLLPLGPGDDVLLEELVGLEADGGGEGLLGEGVVDGLALGTLLLLPLVHGGKADTGADGLVGEAALGLLAAVVEVVTLLLGLAWEESQ